MSRAATIVAVGASLWLIAALAVGGSGLLDWLPRPALQAILLVLTALLLVGTWRNTPLRAVAMNLDLRVLVAPHTLRLLVGAWFLVMCGRGQLPGAFAIPAGWGDVLVGLGAAGAWLDVRRAGLVRAWNALGLADILLVVANAARLGATDPASMRALAVLPLSLLPTFVVPLIIGSHLVIAARLRTRPAR